jgi:hypothetical protein
MLAGGSIDAVGIVGTVGGGNGVEGDTGSIGGVASAKGGRAGIGGMPLGALSVTGSAHCGAAGSVAVVLPARAGAVVPGVVAAKGGAPSIAELWKVSVPPCGT